MVRPEPWEADFLVPGLAAPKEGREAALQPLKGITLKFDRHQPKSLDSCPPNREQLLLVIARRRFAAPLVGFDALLKGTVVDPARRLEPRFESLNLPGVGVEFEFECADDTLNGHGWAPESLVVEPASATNACRFIHPIRTTDHFKLHRNAILGQYPIVQQLAPDHKNFCPVCYNFVLQLVGDGCCPSCHASGCVKGRRGWRVLGEYDG